MLLCEEEGGERFLHYLFPSIHRGHVQIPAHTKRTQHLRVRQAQPMHAGWKLPGECGFLTMQHSKGRAQAPGNAEVCTCFDGVCVCICVWGAVSEVRVCTRVPISVRVCCECTGLCLERV